MKDDEDETPRHRRLIWTVITAAALIYIAALIWGPWIIESGHIHDKNGHLTSSAGTIVTGFRTTLVAMAAGVIAVIGLTYTHRTLQHTKHSQAIGRYTELVHNKTVDLLLRAVDDPDLADLVASYDGEYTHEQKRVLIYAEVQYRNALLAWRLDLIGRLEFFGLVRGLMVNPKFREYWRASRGFRASLPDHAAEARAARIVDILEREFEEADTDLWWVVGEPPTET